MREVDDIVLANLASGADALGRFHRPPTSEDRESHQQAALGIGQQLVAPVDCRLERPLTRDSRPAAAHEQAEAIVQSVANLADRENLHAGGRELNGEWDAVQPPTDISDDLRRLRRQHEPRNGRRALGEQPDGVARRQVRVSPPGADDRRDPPMISPGTLNASRLVVNTRIRDVPPSRSSPNVAHASTRCSQVSTISNR